MPCVGAEHPAQNPGNTPLSELGGAESGAQAAPHPPNGSELHALINAWPTLPPAIRAGILAMVKAAEGQP